MIEVKAKASLGIVPQELAIYEDLSARDNLAYWGAAYGLKGAKLKHRVDHVLNRIGLTDRANGLPKQYSGGMKRRLNFGCGLVHEPRILLLDEPASVLIHNPGNVCLTSSTRKKPRVPACSTPPTTWKRPKSSVMNWPSLTMARS